MLVSRMRPRIVLLLLVTVGAGLVAGFVGQATAGKTKVIGTPVRQIAFGKCAIPTRFRAAFETASRTTGLPLALLVSVANVESTFDPDARSEAGAHGLFQVLPSTAEALKLDVSTPENNVIAGASYLKLLLDQFKSTDLMLAAYVAGPTAVAKAGNRPPNDEAIAYIGEVNRIWKTYNGCR
jgi:soluble lytic murein transglycosylase-like protein